MQRELLPRIPGVSMVRNMRIPIGGKAYTNDLMDGYAMKSATLGNTGFLDEVNTADIETIEVTRGPGSVLYSAKAIGGTINVITRDPPLAPEAGVWGDVGSYGLQRLGARAAGSSEDNATSATRASPSTGMNKARRWFRSSSTCKASWCRAASFAAAGMPRWIRRPWTFSSAQAHFHHRQTDCQEAA